MGSQESNLKVSMRQRIRDCLDAHDGPMWGCEIVAATGCTLQNISNMVSDGSLLKSDEPVSSYSVGIRPRPRLSADERVARRRAFDRQRDAIRRPQRQPAQRSWRVEIVLASSHATVGGESVAEFLERGGRIERIPLPVAPVVYTQRRPRPTPAISVSI